MKNKYFRTNVFKKYFISYFLVIIFIISLIGYIFTDKVSEIIEEEVYLINYKKLQYMDSIIQKSFMDPTENIALTNDVFLIPIFKKNPQNPYAHLEMFYSIKDQLKLKPYIESINVYIPSEELIISSSGIKYDIQNYHDQELIEIISKANNRKNFWLNTRYIASGNPEHQGGGTDINTYIRHSIATTDNNMPLHIIYVNIYTDYINNILLSQKGSENENLFIMNQDHKLFSMSNASADIQDNIHIIEMISNKTERAIKKLDGHNMMINIYYSTSKDFVYALMTPISEFFQKSKDIKITIIYICIFVFLIGIILSLYFSNKHYKPLKKILSSINHSIEDQVLNEYVFIQDTILKLNLSVNELKSKSSINNLLNGMIGIVDEYDMQKMLPFDKTIVIAIKIYNSQLNTEVFAQIEGFFTRKETVPLKLFFVPHNKDSLLIMINFSESTEFIYQYINNAFMEMNNKLEVLIGGGVGSVAYELDDWHTSYEHSLQAIQYNFLKEEPSLFFYSDIIHFKDISISKDYDKLLRSIESNFENIQMIISNLLKSISEQQYRYESIEYIVYEIMPNISKKILEVNLDDQMLFYKNLHVEFYKKSNIYEAIRWLQEIIEKIKSMASDEPSSLTLIKQVKEYIDENYESVISLEMLSQKTFISTSYISLLFKQTYGLGVSEYVSNLRLEKAKVLLENKYLKIEEIAKQVGMSNSTYFITKFKKKYGYTPSQYRLNYKSGHF